MMSEPQAIEARTQEIGRRLLESARREHEHLTTLNRWSRQVLSWCLADPKVKAQVLRFIDTLPSLRTSRAVAQHVREYFSADVRLPVALRLGVAASRPGLATAGAVSAVVHQLVEQVAKQFIVGTTPDDAVQVVERLAEQGLTASFDLLGEQVLSESESDQYAARYVALIRTLSASVEPSLVHVSIKPSSLSSRVDPLAFEDSTARILKRLVPIATTSADAGAAITLDMEHYEMRDLTLEVAKRLLLAPDIGARVRLGVVIQAYLRDSASVIEELLGWLAQHQRRLAVRLVRGAYWDAEIAQASQRGWEPPVYTRKADTDGSFERLTRRLLGARTFVRPEIATHNVRSIAHAMALAQDAGLPSEAVEFQFLYGMGDAIQAAAHQEGYPVRVYAPLGELIPGMAYLVRRILENTANESFLRQEFLHAPEEALLHAP